MKILKEWQGLWAILIVAVLFWMTPKVFGLLGMNSGVVDAGYIHALIFTTAVFFTAIFSAWVALQLDWTFLNKYIDEGTLAKDWAIMPRWGRVVVCMTVILVLIGFYILCYAVMPKP